MSIRRQVAATFTLWCLVSPAFPQNADPLDVQMRQARILQDQGRPADARKIYESLLTALRQNGPAAKLADVLDSLSRITDEAGDYEAAVQYAKESAATYHRAGDSKGEAHALLNWGIAEMDRGSYPTALEALAEALALSRGTNDLRNQVEVLNNQGNVQYFQGNYFDALTSYQQAGATLDHAGDGTWLADWRQVTEFNEATLYQRLGRHEKALEIYRRVEASGQLTAGNRAHLFGNLGALYRRLGDAYKALDAYHLAQEQYSREHDSDGEIGVLKNIGIVYALDLGELSRAEGIFQSALSLATRTHNRREEMQAHLYLGETFFREGLNEKANAEFERALALAQELGTGEEQWKAFYGRGRVEERTGDLGQAESDYRRASSIIEGSRTSLQLSALRAEFLADKRDVYDSLISILMARGDAKEAFAFLERSRARTFQDRFAGLAGSRAPFTMEEAQAHLDPATMLLEYWASADQVGVIWCTREKFGVSLKPISPGENKEIQKTLKDIPGVFDKDWHSRVAALDFLTEDLPDIGSIQHLLVVPDNWVSSVPFDLLPFRTGSSQILLERFDISYLPSATLLRRPPMQEAALRFPWMRQLVAFGDPRPTADLNSNGRELVGSSGELQPLPSSADEVRSIARLAPGKSEIFLGTQNLKRTFLSGVANSAPLLHVSTHAFADVDNPEESRVLFSPESSHAGADYLFLRELYDLDLSNVRMATISACDTERGAILRGEGVQAFSRALLAAGSRATVTTLWRVEDNATAQFMQLFYYFALEKGQPKAQALRLAKLRFLQSQTRLANPEYWAAFVLSGDGLTPAPRVVSWRQLTFFSVVLLGVFLLAVAYILRLRRRNHRQDFA